MLKIPDFVAEKNARLCVQHSIDSLLLQYSMILFLSFLNYTIFNYHKIGWIEFYPFFRYLLLTGFLFCFNFGRKHENTKNRYCKWYENR